MICARILGRVKIYQFDLFLNTYPESSPNTIYVVPAKAGSIPALAPKAVCRWFSVFAGMTFYFMYAFHTILSLKGYFY